MLINVLTWCVNYTKYNCVCKFVNICLIDILTCMV